MDQTFFRLVPSRVSYLEAWRATRSFLEFVLVAIVKTLRIPIARTLGYADGPFQRLEWEELPDDARASLEADRERWGAVGLEHRFCYRYPRIGPHQGSTLVLQSPDGTIVLRSEYEKQAAGNVATVVKSTYLVTRLSNGEWLCTADRGDVFPREFNLAVIRGRTADQLLQRHRDRIAAALPAHPVALRDEAHLEREIIEQNRVALEYAVRRGVLVPMTESEVLRARERSLPDARAPLTAAEGELVEIPAAEVVEAAPPQPVFSPEFTFVDDPAASRHPGVLAEIAKIQNKKAGGFTGLIVLAVSVILFVVLGGLNWDWKFVLLLIPILLFHESGHFVAMRVFKYRNVRMFFIPLFGAAVTGQNYNVPGWKKVIVSLAGPAPGIAVGAALGIAALVLGDKALLMEAAALTVFLNAMNLLPFLPLDGGWVMHALVFSRHYWLDVAFRLVTALALVASGMVGMKFLMFIGVFMLLGLPSIYRVARIAAELRGSELLTFSQDGKTIPTETADAIIDRVQAAFPVLNDNLKARYALQVFENINSRPPGVLATLALGGAYGTSLAAGVAFFALFTVARFTDLGEMLGRAATAPTNSYECGTTEVWPAAEAAPALVPAVTIIATFRDDDQAAAAFAESKPDLSGGARLTRFGQSVFLGLADENEASPEAFVARFTQAGATVTKAIPEQPALVTLDCIAPGIEAATALEQDAQLYFAAGSEAFLIPPWDARQHEGEREPGARLGQLPLEGDGPAPGTDRTAADSGSVTRNGPYLRFYVAFAFPAEGVSALAEWLCENRCVAVKYRFEPDEFE